MPPLIGTCDHHTEATRYASPRCPPRWHLTIRSASRIPIDYKKRFQQFKVSHRDHRRPKGAAPLTLCSRRKTQMRLSKRRRYRGKRPSSSSSAVALWATVRFVPSMLTSTQSTHLCEGLLFCVGVRAADLLGAEPVFAARAQGVAEQRLAEAIWRCRLQGLPRQQ